MFTLIKKNKNNPLFLWFVFLFIVLVVYGKTTANYFVSDDWHFLWLAKDTSWSWKIFATNYEGGNIGGSYNPILIILYKIFFPFFGLKSSTYHFLSLLLHTTNGFLVYHIARKIFDVIKLSSQKSWAIMAAILFLLWPTHAEIINWIAAWPHLWMTTFYLSSLLFYFKYKDSQRAKHFFLSVLFFTLALFTKEVAISLPFVILIWKAYLQSVKKEKYNFSLKNLGVYFGTLAIFLALRYKFIGLLFGYYGKKSLGISVGDWAGNLGAFVSDFFTFGYLREIFFKVWYHHLETVAIVVLISFATYFYWTLIKRKYDYGIIILTFLLTIAPTLPLGLHRMTFAGERYLYLPSVFAIIFLVALLSRRDWGYKYKFFVVAGLLFLCTMVLSYKNFVWQNSSEISRQIVASYKELNLETNQKLISVGLPDNLLGAELFRNNLQQALELNYPDSYPQITHLPIYTQLNPNNKNENLLTWRQDRVGWFAESVDGGYVVTGQTSITISGIYFELWNYNYQNYTANTIRLMPHADIIDSILSGDTKILTYDKGKLKIVE
ncbi:hypothetical protein HON36_01990 [Candidatus Parcubacteria bacterium]|jgi:hypothetical protein|nr:hypothetical protein [Candidatus Parcubacteria bacterium]